MEPKMEQPKQYALDEMAEIEKSRTLSEAGLLMKGAEYSIDEEGNKTLLVPNELSMEEGEASAPKEQKIKQEEFYKSLIKEKGVSEGDKVTFKFKGETTRELITVNGYYVGVNRDGQMQNRNLVITVRGERMPNGYHSTKFYARDLVDVIPGWLDKKEVNLKERFSSPTTGGMGPR